MAGEAVQVRSMPVRPAVAGSVEQLQASEVAR